MGEPRFEVIYDLVAPSEPEARSKARDICIEQTVEVPPSVVEGTWIGDEIVGRIEELTPRGSPEDKVWRARISYPEGAAGEEFPQLMNVLFGLTCQHSQVQLVDFTLTETLHKLFPGPRFGIKGQHYTFQHGQQSPHVQSSELVCLAYDRDVLGSE
eukprot:2234425-Pyramimonas_sp.AAC.1